MKELIERLRDEMLDLPPEPNLPEGDYLEKDWYITKYAVNYSMFWRTQAADAIERLTAERDALRADAEMYRWIEKNTDCSFNCKVLFNTANTKASNTPAHKATTMVSSVGGLTPETPFIYDTIAG